MSEMVERVARATYEARPYGDEDAGDLIWDRLEDGWKDRHRDMARAAIEAIAAEIQALSEQFLAQGKRSRAYELASTAGWLRQGCWGWTAMGEAGPIPDDLLKAARRLKAELNIPENMHRSIEHIARALLAERNRATEKERERCARVAEQMLVFADTTGESDKEIAAAIRKGD